MKRILTALLVIIMTLSAILPVFAAADNSEPLIREFYRADVTVKDKGQSRYEYIDLMITKTPDRVYVNAETLALALGFEYAYTNYDCSFVDRESNTAVMFKAGESAASVYVLDCYMSYTLPYANEYIDSVMFIPLDMALVLLYCDLKVIAGDIVIDMNGLNGVTALSEMLHNIESLRFDYISEIGGDEVTLGKMSDSAKMVNFFNGLITFERKSWGLPLSCITAAVKMDADEIETHPFVASYVSDAAKIFVNMSEAEGRDIIASSQRTGDIVDALGLPIDLTLSGMDKGIGTLNDTLTELGKKAVKDPTLVNSYTLGQKRLDGMMATQKTFGTLTKALDAANKVRHGVTCIYDLLWYYESFASAEEFGIDALSHYGSLTDYYVADELGDFVSDYEAGTLSRFARGIEENAGTIAAGFVNWSAVLGAGAGFILPAWSVVKDTVPYFAEGFDKTGSFLLYEYSAKLMDNSRIYLVRSVKESFPGGSVSESSLKETVLLAYTYLKFSVIARDAAAGSIDAAKMPGLTDRLERKNSELAEYLNVFARCGDPSELFSGYGLLPSLTSSFIASRDDSRIIERFKECSITKIEASYPLTEPLDEFNAFPGGNGVDLSITEEQAIKSVKRALLKDHYWLFELEPFSMLYDFTVYAYIMDDADMGPAYVVAMGVDGSYDLNNVFAVPFDGSAVYMAISNSSGRFDVYKGFDLLHTTYFDLFIEYFKLSTMLVEEVTGQDLEGMINGNFSMGGGDGGGGGSAGGR